MCQKGRSFSPKVALRTIPLAPDLGQVAGIGFRLSNGHRATVSPELCQLTTSRFCGRLGHDPGYGLPISGQNRRVAAINHPINQIGKISRRFRNCQGGFHKRIVKSDNQTIKGIIRHTVRTPSTHEGASSRLVLVQQLDQFQALGKEWRKIIAIVGGERSTCHDGGGGDHGIDPQAAGLV